MHLHRQSDNFRRSGEVADLIFDLAQSQKPGQGGLIRFSSDSSGVRSWRRFAGETLNHRVGFQKRLRFRAQFDRGRMQFPISQSLFQNQRLNL